MEPHNTPPKRFSLVRRVQSFTHAWRGIWVFLKSTHNAWVHLTILFFVVILGLRYQITLTDWALVLLAAGLVIVSEAINTAIEIDIDLTSPNYHPYARDTKDVAAGAVLIASIIAIGIGVLVFVPYLIPLSV